MAHEVDVEMPDGRTTRIVLADGEDSTAIIRDGAGHIVGLLTFRGESESIIAGVGGFNADGVWTGDLDGMQPLVDESAPQPDRPL